MQRRSFAFSIIASLLAASKDALAEAPVLEFAYFKSHTRTEKPLGTGIFITVTTADERTTIAHANNMDKDIKYEEGSDHKFDLTLDSAGIDMNACKQFKASMHMEGPINELWEFKGELHLGFSVGHNMTALLVSEMLENGVVLRFSETVALRA
jgi:hypothetical protein